MDNQALTVRYFRFELLRIKIKFCILRVMKKKIIGSLLLGLLGCTTQIPGEAPTAFSLIEPPDDHRIEAQNDQEVSVEFLWEAPENTDYFILSLRDGDQPEISVLDTIVPKNFTTLNLSQNRNLQWRVSAVNGVIKSASNETHNLTIGLATPIEEPDEEPIDDSESNVPPTITKINPPDGEEISPNNDIPLIWNFEDPDGPGPLLFLIEVDTDPNFTNPRVFPNISQNTVNLTTNPNTLYYWRVQVSDGILDVPDQNPFSFKVLPN